MSIEGAGRAGRVTGEVISDDGRAEVEIQVGSQDTSVRIHSARMKKQVAEAEGN